MTDVLVLGLGNTMRRDDGLGVVAVERLREQYALPKRVEVRVGGVLSPHLLPALEGVRHLILVDAIAVDAPPGSLVRLEGDTVPRAFSARVSLHEMSLSDMLALAEVLGYKPPHIVALGLVPVTVGMGPQLSPQVEAHLDALVEAIFKEIQSCLAEGDESVQSR